MRGYIYIAVAALLMLFPTLANRYSGYSGQYLVAFDMRQSDYFANSVVYVADNKVMGAMGYVLGKAYSADAIKDDPLIPQEIKDANIPVYEGGPLGRDSTLFILKHVISGKDEPAWQGYKVHVMTDEQKAAAVKDVIESYGDDTDEPRYLLFKGYSGWAPMQLELEMLRGIWLSADELGVSLDNALLEDSGVLWHKVFKNVSQDTKKKLGKIY